MPDFSFKVRLSDVAASRLNSSNRPRDAMPFYRLVFDGKVIQSDVCRAAGDPAWEHKCTFEYRLVEDSLEACIESLQHRHATMTILFQDLETGREVPVGAATVDLFTLATGAAKCVYDLRQDDDAASNGGANFNRHQFSVGSVEFTLQVEQQTVVAIELQSVEVHSMREAAPFKLGYTMQSMEGAHVVESVVVSATKEPAWNAAMLPRLMVRTTLRNLLADKLQFTIKDASAAGRRNPNGDASEAFFECLLEEIIQVNQSHTVSFQRNAYAMGGPSGQSSWGALVSCSVVLRDMPALAQLSSGSNVNGQVHGKPLLKSCITPTSYSKWPARLMPRAGGGLVGGPSDGAPNSATMYTGNVDTEAFGRLAPAQRKLQEAVETGRLMHGSPPQERRQYSGHNSQLHYDATSSGMAQLSPNSANSGISYEDAQRANDAIAERRRKLIDAQQERFVREGGSTHHNETRTGMIPSRQPQYQPDHQPQPMPHQPYRYDSTADDRGYGGAAGLNVSSMPPVTVGTAGRGQLTAAGSPNRRLSFEEPVPLQHRPQPPPVSAARGLAPDSFRAVSPPRSRNADLSRETIDRGSFMSASHTLHPNHSVVLQDVRASSFDEHRPLEFKSKSPPRSRPPPQASSMSGSNGFTSAADHFSSSNVLRPRSPFAVTGDSIVVQYEQAVRDIELQLGRVAALRQQAEDDAIQTEVQAKQFHVAIQREEEEIQRDMAKKDRQVDEIRRHQASYANGVDQEMRLVQVEQNALNNELDELNQLEAHLSDMQFRIRDQLKRDADARERARMDALNATARLRGAKEEFHSIEQKLQLKSGGIGMMGDGVQTRIRSPLRAAGPPPPSSSLVPLPQDWDPRRSPTRRVPSPHRAPVPPPTIMHTSHPPSASQFEYRSKSPVRSHSQLREGTAEPTRGTVRGEDIGMSSRRLVPVMMELPADTNVPSPVRATTNNLSPLQDNEREFRSRSPVRYGQSGSKNGAQPQVSPRRTLYPNEQLSALSPHTTSSAVANDSYRGGGAVKPSSMNNTSLSETEKLDVKDLRDAIAAGNVKRFRQLVATSPEALFNSEDCLLDACAAPNPCYEIIAALVSMRPELVNVPSPQTGDTPLHLVCNAKSPACKVLDCLIDAGADAGLHNRDGLTPLHVALMNTNDDASSNSKANMRTFLVRRCGKKLLDAPTAKGETAAHLCVIHDRFLDALRFLHAEGANLSAQAMILRGSGAGELQTPLAKAKMFGASASKNRDFLQSVGAF